MSRSRNRLILGAFVALAALVACRAKDEAPSAGAPAKPAEVSQAKDALAQEPLASPAAAVRPASTRQVIYKADLSVEVGSPADARAKVTSLVEREGGFVASAAQENSEGRAP